MTGNEFIFTGYVQYKSLAMESDIVQYEWKK